jgi:preprotein translocase subunit YajC
VNLVVPALVLAAAVLSTYFFCVRPMRRDECTSMNTMPTSNDHVTTSSNFDADLVKAREELALLRKRTEVIGHGLG